MKFFFLSIVLLISLIVAGCTSINYSSEEKIPVTFANNPLHQVPIRIEETRVFYLWGLVPPTSDVLLDELIMAHEYTNISSLKITESYRLGHLFVSFLTLGLYLPKTFVIEGRSQY